MLSPPSSSQFFHLVLLTFFYHLSGFHLSLCSSTRITTNYGSYFVLCLSLFFPPFYSLIFTACYSCFLSFSISRFLLLFTSLIFQRSRSLAVTGPKSKSSQDKNFDEKTSHQFKELSTLRTFDISRHIRKLQVK